MRFGRCQIGDNKQCQRGVAEMILADTSLLDDDPNGDWECCIRNSIGEAVGNLVKNGQCGCVIWREIENGLEVVVVSPSYIEGDNFDKLSLALGHAQESVDRGISANFFEEGHGLGHYMIAGLTSQSCYGEGGTLTLRYLAESKPKLDCMKLVRIAG